MKKATHTNVIVCFTRRFYLMLYLPQNCEANFALKLPPKGFHLRQNLPQNHCVAQWSIV